MVTKKVFSIKFKKIKSLPSISGFTNITAKDKEAAKRKFKRESVFRRQRIINVVQIR